MMTFIQQIIEVEKAIMVERHTIANPLLGSVWLIVLHYTPVPSLGWVVRVGLDKQDVKNGRSKIKRTDKLCYLTKT